MLKCKLFPLKVFWKIAQANFVQNFEQDTYVHMSLANNDKYGIIQLGLYFNISCALNNYMKILYMIYETHFNKTWYRYEVCISTKLLGMFTLRLFLAIEFLNICNFLPLKPILQSKHQSYRVRLFNCHPLLL